MAKDDDLTPEELEALDELLPPERQTGDRMRDLSDAARVAMQRRKDNSRQGGAVLAALNRRVSWRRIESMTGIPETTARRWATPPKDAKRDNPGQAVQEAPRMTDPTRPEQQPVVAAVLTSERGMLVTWRNDKEPPAGFLTGEIEPGESPADAMVRECKEEAGLLVFAGHEIGRRVHPRTKRTMIYVAGTPAPGKAEVFVGDRDELADVRWISLDEADEAFAPFGGMFPPVREYVRQALGQS